MPLRSALMLACCLLALLLLASPSATKSEEPAQEILLKLPGYILELEDSATPKICWQDPQGLSGMIPELDDARVFPRLKMLIELPPGQQPVIEVLDQDAGQPVAEKRLEEGPFPAGPALELQEPVIQRGRAYHALCWSPFWLNEATGQLHAQHWIRLRIAASAVRENATSAPLDPLPARLQENAILRDRPGASNHALPGTYAVVGYSFLLNNPYMAELIEWKRACGHHVHVLTELNLGSLTAGNIRNAVRDLYHNDSFPPRYLMLVGDTQGSWPVPSGSADVEGINDHYYSLMDDADFLGDIAVGRLSVETQAQMAVVANKILRYQMNPDTLDDNWTMRASLQRGYPAVSMTHLLRSIAGQMVDQGVRSVDTLWYESTDWLENQLLDGVGHYTYRGLAMYGLSTSDVDRPDAFQNVWRTPSMCMFTCLVGNFNNRYGITEAFLRKGSIDAPAGAVSAVGLATGFTHTAFNNVLTAGYYQALLDDAPATVGEALFHAKFSLWATLPEGSQDFINFSSWANLMGDPGMHAWTGPARHLQLESLLGPVIPAGATEAAFRVLDDAGQPVPGACLCIRQAGGYQALAQTDENGLLSFELTGMAMGGASYVLSKPGYRYKRGQLTREEGLAALRMEASSLPEAVVAGSEVLIEPLLINPGFVTQQNVRAVLSANPAEMTLIDSIAIAGDLPAGSSALASPWRLRPLASLPAGTSILQQVQLISDSLSTADCFSVDVVAPHLMLEDLRHPDGSMPLPGDTFLAVLQLRNTGSPFTGSCLLSFSSPSAELLLPDTPLSFSLSEADSTATLNMEISLQSSAPLGAVLPIDIDWIFAEGPEGQSRGWLHVAGSSMVSAQGPDAWGYRVIEDLDGLDLSPEWSWTWANTSLPITDFGDSQDHAIWIDLPFPLIYYGQSWDSLCVCSNGFVSVDPLAALDPHFRDNLLPGPIGPAGMIAPMWDDFYIPNDTQAGIHVHHSPETGEFIIQWTRLGFYFTEGRNTFQLVIQDPDLYPTPTGDSRLLFKYLEYSNTQDAATDFRCSTSGFQCPERTRGLSITHFCSSDQLSTELGNQRVLLITTEEPAYHPAEAVAPLLVHDPLPFAQAGDSLHFILEALDSGGISSAWLERQLSDGTSQLFELQQTGFFNWELMLPPLQEGSSFSYSLFARDASLLQNEAGIGPFTCTVLGSGLPTGPDEAGHLIHDSTDETGLPFTWEDPGEDGQPVDFYDQLVLHNLPLRLVWYGVDYSSLTISSTGVIRFGDFDAWPIGPAQQAGSAENIGNFIAPLWVDETPPSLIFVRHDDEAGRLILTWSQIQIETTSGLQTVQVQLILHDADRHPTANGESAIIMQYLGLQEALYGSIGIQGPEDGLSYWFDGSYDEHATVLADSLCLLVASESWTGDPLETGIPQTFLLEAPAPNPFNSRTKIVFHLPRAGQTELRLFNLLGQHVQLLQSGPAAAGRHQIILDGGGLSSGVYLLRLEQAGHVDSRKLLLLN